MEQVDKVLIVGSKGMAGHVIYHYCKAYTGFNVVDIARNNDFHIPTHVLDVSDFGSLDTVLKLEKPNYVINCIGVLNQDAERNPDKAILLNSYLPHFLAKRGEELGFKLIHISTDCVFSGKQGGYIESSPLDGEGFYSKTKALGEVNYGGHLTIRTSIIGPELNDNGIGLFHWFMQQKGTIKGYTEAYWTGVTTIELSRAIVEGINQNISGLHHLVNGEKINKYDLANLFKAVFKKDAVKIVPYADYKVDKSLVKTDDTFSYQVPSYEIMVNQMKDWIVQYSSLYKYL